MRIIVTCLFVLITLVSCSGIDTLKYHDEISNAREELLKRYENVDKAFNQQTGKPEEAMLLQNEIASFSSHTDSIITSVKGIEKLDDDFLKTAFIEYAIGLKRVVSIDYKRLSVITAVKQESFNEGIKKEEENLIAIAKKEIAVLDDAFIKKQDQFIRKYDITLQ